MPGGGFLMNSSLPSAEDEIMVIALFSIRSVLGMYTYGSLQLLECIVRNILSQERVSLKVRAGRVSSVLWFLFLSRIVCWAHVRSAKRGVTGRFLHLNLQLYLKRFNARLTWSVAMNL
jgi:hypothetical protein